MIHPQPILIYLCIVIIIIITASAGVKQICILVSSKIKRKKEKESAFLKQPPSNQITMQSFVYIRGCRYQEIIFRFINTTRISFLKYLLNSDPIGIQKQSFVTLQN